MRVFLTSLLLLGSLALPARAETLDSIPKPRPGTWSVDTTGKIASFALADADQRGEEVNRQGLGQLAVVVVRTTGGQAPRAFATSLFNRWGIGHAGRNDGTLLFIALNDRKAEIVLGDGVDSGEDTRHSDALMSGEIVPAFKRGDPNAAVLAGVRGLARLLEQSPLNKSASLPPASGAAALASLPRSDLPPGVTQDIPFVPPPMPRQSSVSRALDSVTDASPWTLGVGAGGFVAAGLGLRRWLRRRPRYCADCKSQRILLEEEEDNNYLDPGQIKEENLGSVDYDVWWCESCQGARVERYGAWFTSYGKCPQCAYRTKAEKSTTLQEASYSCGGIVRVDVDCKHCDYRNSFTRSTPKLERSDSSSSSSSSSSFGGGSSSGGGSSGSW